MNPGEYNLLNSYKYIYARQHYHRQQAIAEDRNHSANRYRWGCGHQREQHIKRQWSQDANAIDVGEGHFSTLWKKIKINKNKKLKII